MLDQIRLQAFDETKAEAEARKQQAISEAHEAFSRAYLAEKARHAAEYEQANAAWNAVKSNPNAKGYDKAREEFELSKRPANHDPAGAELGPRLITSSRAWRQGRPQRGSCERVGRSGLRCGESPSGARTCARSRCGDDRATARSSSSSADWFWAGYWEP